MIFDGQSFWLLSECLGHSLRNGGFVNDRRFVLKLLFWKKQENKENIQNILGTCLISNSVFSVQFVSASG